jgi:hypothetical protein
MSRHARFAGLVLVLVVLIAGAHDAAAQTCFGLPAIGLNSKGNVGGNLDIAKQVLGFGANVTYGTEHASGMFEIAKRTYTEFGYTSTLIGFNLAGQIDFGEEKKLSVCPTFRVSGESAKDLNAFSLAESTDIMTAGGAIGWVMASRRQKELVPSLELSFGRSRYALTVPDEKFTERRTIAVLTLGVGAIFDKRFSLRPSISYQFGDVSSHTSFNLMAAIAYGRR